MNLKEQNVLFFPRTMGLGGTENVVLQLCEIMKPLVNKIIVCSCGGMNIEKLNKMEIKHYIIPDIESKSLKTIYVVSNTLRYIVKEENITVIHTHHRMAAFYVSLLGLYRKCYFLNTSHNTFNNKKRLTRFAYKHANLIACGEMVKKNLISFFGVPGSQVTVIYNAAKPFQESVMPDSLLLNLKQDGCFLVGNVGRLSKQKGMEYFIRAIPAILDQCPQARFFIIGTGEEEEKLKKLSAEKKVDHVLNFMGYRNNIQALMKQLDLIVLSSLWEGLPLTPIETFSVGKTIVATAVDGTTEVVENEINGLLVEAKNEEQLADKIVWMIEHPIEKESMEKEAFACFQKEFSFVKFSELYIKCYENL